MTYFRHAAIAAALLAGVGSAGAQTTVIMRAPAETRAVVTAEPVVQLTPVQRHRIYRAIRHERSLAVAPIVEYRVGTRVPGTAQLYALPQQVAVEVPAIRTYKYMMVNDRVVLVDPVTSEVVADFAD
jgi:hypothetical protein